MSHVSGRCTTETICSTFPEENHGRSRHFIFMKQRRVWVRNWKCHHPIMADEEVRESAFSFDELVNIFSYLPPESLAKCSQVCRDWHEASQVGSLWKRHCLQRWTFCHLGKLKPGTKMHCQLFCFVLQFAVLNSKCGIVGYSHKGVFNSLL